MVALPQIDTFDGNVIDSQKWEISGPLGASTVTQNNALILTSDGSGAGFCNTPGLFGPGAGVALRRKISGDFDLQVDFSSFVGSSANFTQAFFNIYQDPDNQLHIKRIRGPGVDGIQTVAKLGGGIINGNASSNPVSSGTFRIVRSGGLITTYFNGAANFSISGLGGDIIASLVLLGPQGESSVAYDNFRIDSGSLVEPPLACPVPPYPFSGFKQPVDNLPTVNTVKGGSAIPVKFSLGGDKGLDIFASGFPTSSTASCPNGSPIDTIEEVVAASNSGLTYDAASDQYTFVWKTDKAWVNTCRQLTVRLNDGTDHTAMFQFTK